jgi:hypothetical protein
MQRERAQTLSWIKKSLFCIPPFLPRLISDNLLQQIILACENIPHEWINNEKISQEGNGKILFRQNSR